MQATTGGCEPAQQSATGFVHFLDIAQKDVDAFPQRYRLSAVCLGDPDVITGELAINRNNCARPAVDFADPENGKSPP